MKRELKHDPDKSGQLLKQILDSDEYKQNEKFNDEVTEYMAMHQTLIQAYRQSYSTGGVLSVTPSSVAMQKASQGSVEKNDFFAKWKKYLREIGKTGLRPTTDELPQKTHDSELKDEKGNKHQLREPSIIPGRR